SAGARRRARVALGLERLVYRDGCTFDEAMGILQTNEHVSESRDELHAIYAELPCRPSRRARALAAARQEPSMIGDGSIAVERAERQELADRTCAIIREGLARRPCDDRGFVRG